MDRYADHPMDLADASLVAAAEGLGTVRVLTLDRADFSAYRVRVGRTSKRFAVVDPLRRG
jgi:predicted nucleic acid-binding protein